jgi:hypothetical protein
MRQLQQYKCTKHQQEADQHVCMHGHAITKHVHATFSSHKQSRADTHLSLVDVLQNHVFSGGDRAEPLAA